MLKIITKPSLLLSLLTFVFFCFPKHSYNPDKEKHTNDYNENLFIKKPSIPDTHKDFILKLIPLIQHSNQEVILERERLLAVNSMIIDGKKIKLPEQRWLKTIEHKYRGKVNASLFKNDKQTILIYIDELLSRVDRVPIRFALAQAAIESGWGSSRFCKEGNAYFGIHCYKSGCGIKAKADEEGGFEVKAYQTVQESVTDYILFLNSKRGMRRFRKERINYFYKDTEPSLPKLANSIKGYSAIGQNYQFMIESILRKYIPENIANN
jgi:Bax protein